MTATGAPVTCPSPARRRHGAGADPATGRQAPPSATATKTPPASGRAQRGSARARRGRAAQEWGASGPCFEPCPVPPQPTRTSWFYRGAGATFLRAHGGLQTHGHAPRPPPRAPTLGGRGFPEAEAGARGLADLSLVPTQPPTPCRSWKLRNATAVNSQFPRKTPGTASRSPPTAPATSKTPSHRQGGQAARWPPGSVGPGDHALRTEALLCVPRARQGRGREAEPRAVKAPAPRSQFHR